MNHHSASRAERPPLSSPDANFVAELPLPDVLKRFTTDLSSLAGAEIALVKSDLAQNAPKVAKSIGLLLTAAVFGVGAFLALTVTLVAAIALVVPLWAAALIVTVLYVTGAAVTALSGKKALASVTSPIPRLKRNLQIDADTLKASFGRGR